jgi:hypothetical protein
MSQPKHGFHFIVVILYFHVLLRIYFSSAPKYYNTGYESKKEMTK